MFTEAPFLFLYIIYNIIHALQDMKGRIALIIDPKVSGPLSLVVEFSTLQTYGVEKIYLLQPSVSSLQTDCDHIVYLTRS